jgi:hypothetical protein
MDREIAFQDYCHGFPAINQFHRPGQEPYRGLEKDNDPDWKPATTVNGM